ncbi:Anhydro-N-acetylmuramic acid kinase [Thalassoporum mexicanum PCC 7367]|uniref:anhydro-N-acetylmuramic acid kinase n=1 Tax=Thalassoporum mexicanum TaxID=3457544 RepID=UPI00029FD5F2|nr:anhydro-N-acetylmuramic acid kinase [Pseudanabaena sp. PCC 7367]AFY69076.1 Anhydro-N-acetylmuramic acid kinase [Pseudanabaena sp. PCC 7367]
MSEQKLDRKLVLGMMSGTSVDGIDAALVEVTCFDRFDQVVNPIQINLKAAATFAYSADLRAEILAVCAGAPRSLAQICVLDDAIAHAFANAAQDLIQQQAIDVGLAQPLQPDLIASHGQTVYHRPPSPNLSLDRQPLEHHQNNASKFNHGLGYTVQLGRGSVIAHQTGIPTASDFRTADINLGGQGAPLAPILDWLLLSHQQLNRVCQNIGGIGNLTFLAAGGDRNAVTGWDNAPGNVLIDMATQQLFGQPFDRDGHLASQGSPNQSLVEVWLEHEFFTTPPPKSTGRELFSPAYLQALIQHCDRLQLSGHDVLATLTEFTARAIVNSYDQFLPCRPDEVLVCGGGSRNRYLMGRLSDLLAPNVFVTTTDACGVDADFKEAIAFAVLGFLCLHDLPGNLPSVTGARAEAILGRIDLPLPA